MSLVMVPASDRSRVDLLANLPHAQCRDRALRAVEVEAGRLPIETEEIDQPAALPLEIANQRLVIDGQHAERKHTLPMRRETRARPRANAAIDEIVGEKITLVEALEEIRKGGVARVAADEDDSAAGKQHRDEAEKHQIVRRLVDDSPRLPAEATQPIDVLIGKQAGMGGVPVRQPRHALVCR